jgi:hypothetical protein
MPARTARDSAFITKSITKSAFALTLPSGPLPDAHVSVLGSTPSCERNTLDYVYKLERDALTIRGCEKGPPAMGRMS